MCSPMPSQWEDLSVVKNRFTVDSAVDFLAQVDVGASRSGRCGS